MFGYRFFCNKITIDFGLSGQLSKFLLSSRVYSYNINSSLEQLFSSSFLNNKDKGELRINTFFIGILKTIKNHKLNINISYHIDQYRFDVQNNLYNLINIIFPKETETFKLDYKRKNAIVFSISDEITINKYKLSFYFSQHIPIKIIKWEDENTISTNDNQVVTHKKIKNKFKYGGGYLQLYFSIPLN